MAPGARSKKLKAIKNGDSVRISGEVFQVNSVEPPQDGSRNISLELEGSTAGWSPLSACRRPKCSSLPELPESGLVAG